MYSLRPAYDEAIEKAVAERQAKKEVEKLEQEAKIAKIKADRAKKAVRPPFKGPQPEDKCNRCHQLGHWARDCIKVWPRALGGCRQLECWCRTGLGIVLANGWVNGV